jgi:hypothetical protein
VVCAKLYSASATIAIFLWMVSKDLSNLSLICRVACCVPHDHKNIPNASHDSHYRKHINFRGPGYFRRPTHENTMLFSSALVTDENVSYFRGPVNIFVGRLTKI